VLEIVPGTNGIVLRLERSPGKAQELEPVARDTYMRNLAILRSRRDINGAIVGFDHGNPVVRQLSFGRVGERRDAGAPGSISSSAAAASAAPAARSAVPVSEAPPLEHLVGEHELAPGRSIAITLDDGQLSRRANGQPEARADARHRCDALRRRLADHAVVRGGRRRPRHRGGDEAGRPGAQAAKAAVIVG
jgi:hypothetical protein